MLPIELIRAIQPFRADLHGCFGRREDALFELVDTLLSGGRVQSLAHLSLEAGHRRTWGSVYAALAQGHVDAKLLSEVIIKRPLAEGQPIYAVDVSVWSRCDAETSPERGYYYHPSRHSAGQPIVAGWAYQWMVQLSFARDSWTAPVDVRRVHPLEDDETVAVEQIRALLEQLGSSAAVPLFVFDAGDNPVALTQGLAGSRAAILVRLRSDRCFFADPPSPVPGSKNGRPRRHGARFDCKDPTTWWLPTAEHRVEDEQYGTVHVQAWADLHPKQQNHATRGTRQPRPIVRGTLIRVEVTRLPNRPYRPKVLWLWWRGPDSPDLDIIWRAYVRRFDIEHTLRFCKQELGWTTPRVRSPEQADRWTWLVVAAYTQLRLARPWVADRRLPWERPLDPDQLTPYRVRRAIPALLLILRTPAIGPKPSGRSPGRPKGRRSGRAKRHPTIKKSA